MEEIILEQFFINPMSKFGVRELSRKTHLDTKTVMKYLKLFVKKKLVIKQIPKDTFPYYEANRLSPLYKFEKRYDLLKKLLESNLVNFLEKKLRPKAVVVFGSAAKGTYHEKSDIDIFIHGKYKRIDLERYAQKFGHRINLLFEEDLHQLSSGLLENIYNGEILSGKLEIL